LKIYKRKEGGVYWCRYKSKGEDIRKSTFTTNLRAAKEIADAYKLESTKEGAGLQKRQDIPTLKEFYATFLEVIDIECPNRETRQYYRDKMTVVLQDKSLANTPLNKIEGELLTKYLTKKLKDYEVATVNHHPRAIKRALRIAAKRKIVSNPNFSLLKGENKRDLILNAGDDETTFFENAVGEMERQFLRAITVVLSGGYRNGELCTIEQKHVHLDPEGNRKVGYVFIPNDDAKLEREIPLTPTARKAFIEQMAFSAGSKLGLHLCPRSKQADGEKDAVRHVRSCAGKVQPSEGTYPA
jgi:hypothetical protein